MINNDIHINNSRFGVSDKYSHKYDVRGWDRARNMGYAIRGLAMQAIFFACILA